MSSVKLTSKIKQENYMNRINFIKKKILKPDLNILTTRKSGSYDFQNNTGFFIFFKKVHYVFILRNNVLFPFDFVVPTMSGVGLPNFFFVQLFAQWRKYKRWLSMYTCTLKWVNTE